MKPVLLKFYLIKKIFIEKHSGSISWKSDKLKYVCLKIDESKFL